MERDKNQVFEDITFLCQKNMNVDLGSFYKNIFVSV